jgi:hypothetical protein
MKIKTSELIGPSLDWAVAKCEGRVAHVNAWGVGVDNGGLSNALSYSPSTDWSQGGPIIERERITVGIPWPSRSRWEACVPTKAMDKFHVGKGKTFLVAAMRCFVASRLGEEVEVPDDLTQGVMEVLCKNI